MPELPLIWTIKTSLFYLMFFLFKQLKLFLSIFYAC